MGNSLAVQWLGLHALNVEGLGSIPGQGTKIPQAVWHGQKKKKTPTDKQKRNKTKNHHSMQQCLPIIRLLPTCPHISLILLFLSNASYQQFLPACPLHYISNQFDQFSPSHPLILLQAIIISCLDKQNSFSFNVVTLPLSCPQRSQHANF